MYEQYLMRFYAEALAEGFQTQKSFLIALGKANCILYVKNKSIE